MSNLPEPDYPTPEDWNAYREAVRRERAAGRQTLDKPVRTKAGGKAARKPMNATLSFTLPEESEPHLRAIHAEAAWGLLERMDHELKALLKHGHEYASVEQLAQQLRGEIAEVLSKVR